MTLTQVRVWSKHTANKQAGWSRNNLPRFLCSISFWLTNNLSIPRLLHWLIMTGLGARFYMSKYLRLVVYEKAVSHVWFCFRSLSNLPICLNSDTVHTLHRRGFTTKQNMMDHWRLHTDFREFTCITCGQQFKWKLSLGQSIRNPLGTGNRGPPSIVFHGQREWVSLYFYVPASCIMYLSDFWEFYYVPLGGRGGVRGGLEKRGGGARERGIECIQLAC